MDGEMADEIAATLVPLRAELERLQEAALFNGEYDTGDAVVTLQSGTGGTDAQDWAEMMLRMYDRWAANRGFRTAAPRGEPGGGGGPEERDVHRRRARTRTASSKAERGKHRLVRQSPFDQAHRRHTAFATVIVAPLLADDVDVEIDEADLKIDTYRAQGAGGQHVNKTDSAVRITHLPSGIVVASRTSARSRRTSRRRCASSRPASSRRPRRNARRCWRRNAEAPPTPVSAANRPLLHLAPVPTRQGHSYRPRDRERPARPRRRPRRLHPRVPAGQSCRKGGLNVSYTRRNLRTGRAR